MQLNKYCFSVIAAVAMVMSAQAVITESEPNNDSSSATTITRGATPWSDNGQVEFNPAGDNDWFKINLTVGETLIVQTTPLIDDFDPDTVMAVVDPSGTTVLTFDDDGGPGFGSRVAYTATATGTYYVAITGYHGGGQSALSYYTGAHSEQGPYLIEASITAAPANSWNEAADGGGDAGKLPETAQSTAATQCARTIDAIIGNLDPSDADMFAIYISDPGAFSATTVGATSFDTQLWLFDANGNGVTFNDDSGGLQSTITGQFITGPGTYYIAISSYDHDPAGCNGGEIWADTPFGTERAPDGADATSGVDSWTGTGGGSGSYTILLTGVCTTPRVSRDRCEFEGWDEDNDGGGDAGELPDEAQIITRSNATPCTTPITTVRGNLAGIEADMYVICITDPGAFQASTVGTAGFDTQLWLFNCDGTGVTFNDDAVGLQSTITGQFLTAGATYLLAISQYDYDPVDDSGNELWADTPFGVERAPDGPGAANPVAGWTGSTAGGGSYRIALQGAYFVAEDGCGSGPCEQEGDTNGDCCVNDTDLLEVLLNFGSFGFGQPGDLNGDFIINDADLLIVLLNFGSGNCNGG